jgi:hypothetical protein
MFFGAARPRGRRSSPGRGHRLAAESPPGSRPARATSHAITEFEFHISPARNSSRPHTGVGTDGTSAEQSTCLLGVVAQASWTLDRLGDIRDDAIAPAAQLVAEVSEASRPAASDRAFGDDATLLAVAVGDWRLLDHEAALRHAHLKRRVVKLARRLPLERRCHRLLDASVQPNGVAARAER